MRARPRSAIAAASIALAVLAGCGDDDDAGGPDEGPDRPSTTVVQQLEDGEHFGFILGLQVNDATVTGRFDVAELLTGEDARDAAVEAGTDPLDFFVRNPEQDAVGISVDPNAEVLAIDPDDCCEARATDVPSFVADRDASGEARTPARVTVEDGTVTRIEEVYLP